MTRLYLDEYHDQYMISKLDFIFICKMVSCCESITTWRGKINISKPMMRHSISDEIPKNSRWSSLNIFHNRLEFRGYVINHSDSKSEKDKKENNQTKTKQLPSLGKLKNIIVNFMDIPFELFYEDLS